MEEVFGMNKTELLVLGVVGFFIFKGAKRLVTEYPAEIRDKLIVDTYNTAAGGFNWTSDILGGDTATTTGAFTNDMGEGYAILTTTPTMPEPPPLFVGAVSVLPAIYDIVQPQSTPYIGSNSMGEGIATLTTVQADTGWSLQNIFSNLNTLWNYIPKLW